MKAKEIYRSPLFYVGDKYKLIPEIKPLFPKNIQRFIEPFVGGASVSLNVDADSYLLNDIDSNVIDLHKLLCFYMGHEDYFFDSLFKLIDYYGLSCSYVKDVIPVELKKANPKTYYARFNKRGYERMRADYNSSDRQNVLMLYLLLIYGFNHMLRFNKKGDFNLPVGNVDFNRNVETALNSYFRIMSSNKVAWSAMDFRKFLDSIQFKGGDFVYLDPPYLITFSEYNKLWGESEERGLLAYLDLLNEKGVAFAISNVTFYKDRINTTFLDWAEKYTSHSIKSNYISYHDNSSKVLVTNY